VRPTPNSPPNPSKPVRGLGGVLPALRKRPNPPKLVRGWGESSPSAPLPPRAAHRLWGGKRPPQSPQAGARLGGVLPKCHATPQGRAPALGRQAPPGGGLP
jgi:hypothetical protein